MLYVLYCAAGTGAAFVYSGSIGSALKWFKEKRGLASGIMAAGFRGRHGALTTFHSAVISAQVGQGEARSRVGHHGSRLRRRHGALHSVHLVDDRVARVSGNVPGDR